MQNRLISDNWCKDLESSKTYCQDPDFYFLSSWCLDTKTLSSGTSLAKTFQSRKWHGYNISSHLHSAPKNLSLCLSHPHIPRHMDLLMLDNEDWIDSRRVCQIIQQQQKSWRTAEIDYRQQVWWRQILKSSTATGDHSGSSGIYCTMTPCRARKVYCFLAIR